MPTNRNTDREKAGERESWREREMLTNRILQYSQTCLKRTLRDIQNKGCKDKWMLNEGRNYIQRFCFLRILHLLRISFYFSESWRVPGCNSIADLSLKIVFRTHKFAVGNH